MFSARTGILIILMKKTIFLDTSFLLDILTLKIDLESELRRVCDFDYELVSYDLILKELEGKKGENIARMLLEKRHIRLLKPAKPTKSLDEIFLTLKEGAVVATNDRELKKGLKSKHIKILSIRQKKYLVLD